MKTAKAEITAVVQCPECGEPVRLSNLILVPLLHGYGAEVACPHCKEHFNVELK